MSATATSGPLAGIDDEPGGTRDEWTAAISAAWRRTSARRIRDVVRPDQAVEAIRRALTPEAVRGLVGPLIREVGPHVVATLREDPAKLGEFVPEPARRAIERLLERSDLVPDALVRKLFEQQAVQDAIYDTLYDGITQFNTTVNPFFAEWGLPAFLKRVPIGGSVILASMEALRSEFERRLEPELKKFLEPFSRRATGQLADVFLAKSSDRKLVELRKNLALFLYSQSIAALLARVDDDATKDAGTAVEQIVIGIVEDDRLATRLGDVLGRFVAAHGDETVGEWLTSIGADADARIEDWAGQLWTLLDSTLPKRRLRAAIRRFADGHA